MTTTWTTDELDRVGSAEELRIASLRQDGRLSKPRTIWVVRADDALYVRSVYGPRSDWYRSTRVRQEGHIQAGGVAKDVALVDAGEETNGVVDAAYRNKYSHYAAEIIRAITSPEASSTTMRLDPR
ncbi:DUF2255 family protein [Streptomyces sp. NPDC058464]|uniref:DUF2255 family protein n=1 Tax=Streptomyces sp. NPDC058464 TaxID=3346511 RepID=UPI00365B625D